MIFSFLADWAPSCRSFREVLFSTVENAFTTLETGRWRTSPRLSSGSLEVQGRFRWLFRRFSLFSPLARGKQLVNLEHIFHPYSLTRRVFNPGTARHFSSGRLRPTITSSQLALTFANSHTRGFDRHGNLIYLPVDNGHTSMNRAELDGST